MITKVKLQRFKKFKNNEIVLKPFTVLMGENSCGKTTVIQAINLSLNTFAKSDLITLKNEKAVPKARGIGATALPGINISDFRELYYGKVSRQSKKSNKYKPLSAKEDVEEQIAQLDNYELAKSVISGKMVFIEDANIEIWETVDKILGTKVFYGANTVSIHKGRSKDDKMPFQIKPLLKDFLNKDIDIIFIRDSDGLPDEWKQKIVDYGKSKSVQLYLLDMYEIENYLLNGELIHRALYKKYPQSDNMPTVDQIERKIYDSLRNTIVMSRYKYDDNLEDSIFKASLILNLQEYRNNNEVKREAEKIRMRYEESDDKETYKKIGMGKEALRQIFNWFNSEMRLNLNKDDILEVMEEGDIPIEIKNILKSLQSNMLQIDDINELEEYEESSRETDVSVDVDLLEENSVDEIVQLSLPFGV